MAFTNNMTTAKRHRKSNFTQVQNEFLEDNRLSWKAKGVLIYLLSRPEEGWTVNQQDIINRSKDSGTAVKSALKELKALKYLYIIKAKDYKGKFNGSMWIYDDIPFECPIEQ